MIVNLHPYIVAMAEHLEDPEQRRRAADIVILSKPAGGTNWANSAGPYNSLFFWSSHPPGSLPPFEHTLIS